jgi:hypothetical protein
MTLAVPTCHMLRYHKWVRIPAPISGNKSWRRTVRLQIRGSESCAVFWPLLLAPNWVRKCDRCQAPCAFFPEAFSAPQCTLCWWQHFSICGKHAQRLLVQVMGCFVTSVCCYAGQEQPRRGTRLRAQFPPTECLSQENSDTSSHPR